MGIGDVFFGSESKADVRSHDTMSPEQKRLLNEVLMPYLSQDLNDVQGAQFKPQYSHGQYGVGQGQHGGFGQAYRAQQARAGGGGGMVSSQPYRGTGNPQPRVANSPGGGQNPPVQHNFTSPLTSGEAQSLEAMEQMALNPQGPSEGQQFLQQSLQGSGDQNNAQHVERFLNEQPADFDQYYQDTVYNPLMEQFQEDILPTISRRAAGSGNYYSSDRVDADAKATEELIGTLGRERGRLSYEAYQDSQNRGLQAGTVATQADLQAREQDIQAALGEAGIDMDKAGLELQTLTQNLAAQGLPREVQDQELSRQYADFLRREGVADDRVNQILATLGLQTQENIATVSPGSSGLFDSFLSGGGGAALVNTFF